MRQKLTSQMRSVGTGR